MNAVPVRADPRTVQSSSAKNFFNIPPRLSWRDWYIFAGIALYSGALDRFLAGNPSSFVVIEGAESPLIQAANAFLLLISFGLILTQKVRVRPSLLLLVSVLMVSLCFVSSGWSDFPEITIRRSIVYGGTVAFAFASASLLSIDRMISILTWSAILLLLVTFALQVVGPAYAFHQGSDVGVAEHAGRLRGSYMHKNDLGRYVALATLIVVVAGWTAVRPLWLRVALIILGCLLMMETGSAKVLGALPIALGVGFVLLSTQKPSIRVPVLILTISLGGIALLTGWADIVYNDVLSALGRSSTLTGRTAVWRAAEISIADHFWIGRGYATGFRSQAMYLVQQLLGAPLGHAHNGYLQVMVDLGIVGLLVALAPTAILIIKLIVTPVKSSRIERTGYFLAAVWGTFFLFMNYTGSYLAGYKDLFSIFPIWAVMMCGLSVSAASQRPTRHTAL